MVGFNQAFYRETAIFFFLHIFDPEAIVSSGMPYLLHGAGSMPEYSLIKVFRNVFHIFFQRLLPVNVHAAWQTDGTVLFVDMGKWSHKKFGFQCWSEVAVQGFAI